MLQQFESGFGLASAGGEVNEIGTTPFFDGLAEQCGNSRKNEDALSGSGTNPIAAERTG